MENGTGQSCKKTDKWPAGDLSLTDKAHFRSAVQSQYIQPGNMVCNDEHWSGQGISYDGSLDAKPIEHHACPPIEHKLIQLTVINPDSGTNTVDTQKCWN
jgi:hypothetical protein